VNRSFFCGVALSLLLAGCGSSSPPSSFVPGTSNPLPTPGGGTLGAPIVINVNGAAAGVDINVASPVGANPNAQVLGVAPLSSDGGSADNTGAQMHRGTAMHVLLFGPGLSGTMEVRLSGPQDYSITNKTTISSTQSTPGIEFDLAINGDAALGARTVFLTDSQNNVTTFSGGLEVLP